MGSMEKKRLLFVIASIFLFSTLAAVSFGKPSRISQEEEVKTKPDEKSIRSAETLIRNLKKPDLFQAEKILRETKRNPLSKKEIENARDFFSRGNSSRYFSLEHAPVSKNERAKLFYFFSFSMPTATLKEVSQEIAPTRGIMVLRGLSGENLRETVFSIKKIIDQNTTEVWIEPFLFECFAVEAVPQLVLVSEFSEETGCEAQKYLKVSGDIPISRVLEVMKKEDKNAEVFYKRIEKNGFYDN